MARATAILQETSEANVSLPGPHTTRGIFAHGYILAPHNLAIDAPLIGS